MATSLTLHVIWASDVPTLSRPPLDACGGHSIVQWFAKYSFGQILMKSQKEDYPLKAGTYSTAMTGPLLHTMLREFVPSPMRVGPVADIALIFCKNWVHQNLLGLMFDYDGSDPRIGSPTSKAPGDTVGVPREGCAVFLDALAGESPEHVMRTAIHELGHVFNLHHDDGPEGSFMTPGGWAEGFNKHDRDILKNAGSGATPDDLPGASNFVANGDGSAITARADRKAGGLRSPRLRLDISVDNREYLIGETIVLDVELAPIGKTSVHVPNHLDPGYEAFRIWIETPEGERFIHRPLFRFSPTPGLQTEVSQSSPLRNNPRITMGANGLNFRIPGEYRIWAEFRLPNSSKSLPLLSRQETIRVRRPTTRTEARLARLLSARDIAFFVACGGGPIRDVRRSQLLQAIRQHRGHPAVGHIRYTFAKDMARQGRTKAAEKLLAGLEFAQPSLRRGLERLRIGISAHR